MKNPRLVNSPDHRRPRTSAAERIGWVQAWERSDLTQEAFAQAHELKVGTLRNWIRQHDQRPAARADRVDLHEIQLDQVIGGGLRAAAPGWELEIRLPSGLVIAGAPGTAPSRLRDVLEAVRCRALAARRGSSWPYNRSICGEVSIGSMGTWPRSCTKIPSRVRGLFFCNRRRTRIKILVFDGTGLWILNKRLSAGKFSWPTADRVSLSLRNEEFAALVNGLEVVAKKNWHREWVSS